MALEKRSEARTLRAGQRLFNFLVHGAHVDLGRRDIFHVPDPDLTAEHLHAFLDALEEVEP
jgi:hypothetical protein